MKAIQSASALWIQLRMIVFTLATVNLGSNDNVGNGGGQLGMALLSIWKVDDK